MDASGPVERRWRERPRCEHVNLSGGIAARDGDVTKLMFGFGDEARGTARTKRRRTKRKKNVERTQRRGTNEMSQNELDQPKNAL